MPWLRISLLPAPLLWVRAITRPECVALTPVPQAAAKSTPAWSRRVPQIGWVRHPKFEFIRMSMGRIQPLLDAAEIGRASCRERLHSMVGVVTIDKETKDV